MSAGVGYSLGPLTLDQIDFLHAVPSCVLVAVSAGQVDFNLLALQELANRGCDGRGVWVGYRAAKV